MKNTNTFKICIVVSALSIFVISKSYSQSDSNITMYEASVNHQINPIGIDDARPDFSWKLKSNTRKKYQNAYQIVVWHKNTKDTFWNSKKVISDNNILVKYAGKKLKSVRNYSWKVRIWDNNGKTSSWSKEQYFSTGLMSEDDWQAEWISTPDSLYAPVFIKEFRIDKMPDLANIFVNCQGYFELYINGKKVGKEVLSPAVSDFRFENYYLTYDIRNFLKPGKNTIGLWTARGWYSFGLPGVIHKSPVFRAQAHFISKQSSRVIVSDTTWRTSNSSISQIGNWRWNDMGGELIDSRINTNDWLIDSIKTNVILMTMPQAITKSQICKPNIISDTILVKNISQIDKDVWLIDFGKNFTGWMKMKIKNQNPGDTIDFIYSDFSNKTPEKKSKYNWDFGNEGINQRDAYIGSQADSGVFCPKFNFHAFRYVLIQGLRSKPKFEDIAGYMIESNIDEVGHFTSSDNDLNAIYELNRFTFRCLDIGGYYVDCPHRERLGYGDGQVAVETGIYNFDLYNYYKKWATNWLVGQNANGDFLHTAPSPYGAGGGPGWGGTGVVLPWKIYKYFGDTSFLSSAYNSMAQYVNFLETKTKDGILRHYGDEEWGFIGDWVPPGRGMDAKDKVGKTEKEVFNNCYLIYLYNILTECAEVLQKIEDCQKYKRKSETLQDIIHEKYFNTEKGIYANGEQPYLSFPLLMDVPNKNEKNRVLANLEHTIKITNDGHLNTGMLGTYFMLQHLTEIGRSDLVYLMMKQKTYPGWGYMIAQGANTSWEQWNGYWSNIHSCFTSGGGWFFTGVAGIRQVSKSVAFKHLLIAPQLTDVIKEQHSSFNSPYGEVVVSWNHTKNSSLQVIVEIPVNTKADIILPVSTNQIVYESGKIIGKNSDIVILSKEASQLLLFVPSGKYTFEIRNQ